MRIEWTAMSAALAGTVALLCGPASAADDYWTYRDWTVRAVTVDTGEDTYTQCIASTGGDGMPTLVVDITTQDAFPPDGYPSVGIEEHAPRHYATMIQNNDAVNFLFDDGDAYTATAYAGIDAEGIAEAYASFQAPQSLSLLQGMRRAGQLEVITRGQSVYTASLNGFTAAYGKMAEACGFSTEGVIE